MTLQAYPERWILLAVVCFLAFSQSYCVGGFVALNNVVTEFYRIIPYQTDLLAVLGSIFAVPVGLVTAFYSDKLGLRSLMLFNVGLALIGAMVCLVGFLSRKLFYVTAIGRILMVAPFGTIFTTQALLAARWFPADETATAFSLLLTALKLGMITAGLVYPNVIPNANFANVTNEEEHAEAAKSSSLAKITHLRLPVTHNLGKCFQHSLCPNIKNTIPGYIFVITIIIAAVTYAFAGRAVDKFKHFKAFSVAGAAITLLANVGLFFAFRYKNLSAMYVLYPAFELGRSIFFPASMELLLETTYPANKILTMSVATAMQSLTLFIHATILRFTLARNGAATATGVAEVSVTASLLLTSLVKLNYKRLKEDKVKTEKLLEESPPAALPE